MAHEIAPDETSSQHRKIRTGAFFLGAITIFWLTIEDTGTTNIFLLATFLCLLAALNLIRTRPTITASWIAKLIVGAFAGGAIAPVMIGLMILKIGLHSHGTPDFTPNEMTQVLRNLPIWAVSGLLVGLGSHLFYEAKQTP